MPIVKKPVKDSPFQKSRNIQSAYERSLKNVAKEVFNLIRGYNPTDIMSAEKLKRALRAYSEILEPWAQFTVRKFLQQISNQDAKSWREHTKRMSLALQKEILNAPTGEAFRLLMQQNVGLITSIPINAAEKVHEMVTGNLGTGARPISLVDEIMKMGDITRNRAVLIARTETARAANTLTQARAEYVGSEGYIWRTSRDLIVRESHRKMNGVFVKWTEPPILDKMVGHAGTLPNCRCYSEPVIPEG